MHGLANGSIRDDPDGRDVFQAFDGPDTAYPDGLITDKAIQELKELAATDKPFFLAVGLIRPHLPFGAPKRYLDLYRDTLFPPIPHPEKPVGKTTWHRSGEFMKYERWGKDPNTDKDFANEARRHYAACVSYVDAQVGKILKTLDETGAAKNTIVVVWGDHGWHLGEHAVWGKHTLFEESLHSPLIIRGPGMKEEGSRSNSVVETVDIYPSLCGLAGLPTPEGLDGQPLLPPSEKPATSGNTAISYSGKGITLRTDTHRLIAHKDGFLELYDHRQPDAETRNLAKEQPELAAELEQQLKARISR